MWFPMGVLAVAGRSAQTSAGGWLGVGVRGHLPLVRVSSCGAARPARGVGARKRLCCRYAWGVQDLRVVASWRVAG